MNGIHLTEAEAEDLLRMIGRIGLAAIATAAIVGDAFGAVYGITVGLAAGLIASRIERWRWTR